MAARPETTPDPRPRIFISAVSKEFADLRRRTDEWVRRLGCEPETMEVWGTEPGDLRALLREKIDACKGLIQIVGEGYGAEPPTPDPDFGRVSYTQYEFLSAQSQGKTTWLFPAGAEADCRTPATPPPTRPSAAPSRPPTASDCVPPGTCATGSPPRRTSNS